MSDREIEFLQRQIKLCALNICRLREAGNTLLSVKPDACWGPDAVNIFADTCEHTQELLTYLTRVGRKLIKARRKLESEAHAPSVIPE